MSVLRLTSTMFAAVLLLSVFTAPAVAEQRVALVIGNAAYAHAPVLASPLNNAADMGAALGRLGFAVTRIENAGYAALRRSLQQFASAASSSEVALVFYSGHTIQVDESNFLVPVDARLLSDGDVEFETVPLALVLRAVERAPGLGLLVLDASRENPFAASIQRTGATRSIGRGLARVEPSGETLVAYAAKAGTVASDGRGRNSPYSAALLRHLEDSRLEVGRMFRRVRDTVLATTNRRQEPVVYGSQSNRRAYLARRLEPAPAQGLAAERELLFWESVKDRDNPGDLRAYLERYPNGAFAVLARNRLNRLLGTAGGAEAEPGTAAGAIDPARSALGPEAAEVALGLERSERLRIQEGLAALGYDPGPADGLFGRRTRSAIGNWQRSQGGEATDYLDAEAARTLLAAADGRRSPRPERGSLGDVLEVFSTVLRSAEGGDSDTIQPEALADILLGRAESPVGRPSLTARFVGMPSEHRGPDPGAFSFRVLFSEAAAVSYKVLRDKSFRVRSGTVRASRRVDRRDDFREIEVEPTSWGDVTITLPGGRACNTAGAICTADGRTLSNTLTATVPGPVLVSVENARARENAGEVLAFQVRLSRAAPRRLRVDYATSDGSATAGVDYAQTSGTVVFAAGDTTRTVIVTVLDDTYDEGEEMLTLTLSNAGGSARIADGTATGTIEN